MNFLYIVWCGLSGWTVGYLLVRLHATTAVCILGIIALLGFNLWLGTVLQNRRP